MNHGTITYCEFEGTGYFFMADAVNHFLSKEFDSYLEETFSSLTVEEIVLDITRTQRVDSTMLGQWAKLSKYEKDRTQKKVTLISTQDDLNFLLENIGFHEVFDLVKQIDSENRNNTIHTDRLKKYHRMLEEKKEGRLNETLICQHKHD